MKQASKFKTVLNALLALGVCGSLLFPVGISGKVSASEEGEQVEAILETGQEGEITTRGLQRKMQKSSMRKTQAASKSASTGTTQQLAKLRQQVNALQAQVNALRAVIQVSNGMTTVQSKHIRIQGETVTIKSLKHGVTIESKKDLKLESKRDMIVKASSKMDIHAGSNLSMKGNGTTTVQGTIVKLNNGKKPVASLGSPTLSGPVGGPGKVTSGSPTVLVP